MPVLNPFYDPYQSYEDNYINGPFGYFSKPAPNTQTNSSTRQFLGQDINLPFGIPSGPLLNANYIKAAFDFGFDLCVYKTVRSQKHKCHPLPNILSVHPNKQLTNHLDTVLADTNFSQPLSITNSFGVPSFDPDIWQPDMASAVSSAKAGQCVIGSFQGTQGKGAIEKDYALAAKLVNETGALILETNLSCPNEGVSNLLCFDLVNVERIVHAIKTEVPNKPLIIKLAYFSNNQQLEQLLIKIGKIVDGISTINTISAKPVNQKGQPALGNDRIESGVCGDAIRWAGLDMVQRLANLRQKLELSFTIIGVGGMNNSEHYQQYRQQGADAVMSATGAMWDPLLAIKLKQDLRGKS